MPQVSILAVVHTPSVRGLLEEIAAHENTGLRLHWLTPAAAPEHDFSSAPPHAAILLEWDALPGPQTAVWLRRHPVIALGAEAGLRSAAMEQGACDFLDFDQLSAPALLQSALHVAALNKVHEDLALERRRYRDLLDNVHDLIYMRAPDGRITEWNLAGERLTGYTREQMLGRDLLEIVAPEDRELAHQMHERKLAGEASTRYEIGVIRQDGARIELEINSRPVRPQARVTAVSGIARDITQSRQTQRSLRSSEELFRRLFETAPIGLALVGNDRKFQRGNPALRAMFGYGEDELKRLEPGQLGLPEDEPISAKAREQFHQTGVYGPVRKRYIRHDGQLIWVDTRAIRVLDDQGLPLYNLAIMQDITEQVETEAALRESEQRYRSLISSASLGIVLSDREGALIETNPAFTHIFGDHDSGLAGQNWRDLYPPEVYAGVRRQHTAILNREAPSLQMECNFLNPAGREISTRLTSMLILNQQGEPLYINADGQPLYILDLIEDITEHRQLEQRLRRSERLETIGRLAGGLAHDFNNLLTIMNGAGRMLWNQAAHQPAMREPLEQLLKAGERASALSSQLLTIGKSEPVERKRVNLHKLLPELASEWRKLAGENARLNLRLAPEPLWIMAHRGQMERLLSNLISNAADSLPGTGGVIDVEVRPRHWDHPHTTFNLTLSPGDYVEISVSDTGTGMDEATRAHLFEPFFTSKEFQRGTGLGLAIVHGIAEQNQAGLAVESIPGNGSRITLFWPQTAAPAVAARPQRLLVVDDEEGVRWFTRSVLELAGFDVVETAGADAAERWSGQHPEPLALLITDVIMPGMTGVELASRLQAQRPGLPVLYMSAYAPPTLRLTSSSPAGDISAQVLTKPFTPEQLLEQVRRQLAARS